MMTFKRQRRDDVVGLVTARMQIGLNEGQYFCETNGGFELWQDTPLPRMLKRISHKSIFWIISNQKPKPVTEGES